MKEEGVTITYAQSSCNFFVAFVDVPINVEVALHEGTRKLEVAYRIKTKNAIPKLLFMYTWLIVVSTLYVYNLSFVKHVILKGQ